MARTTFAGPIRTGLDTGIPGTTTVGSVVLSQETTVTRTNSAQTLVARLPDNSDVHEFLVTVTSAFSSGFAGIAEIRIGTTANETRFGTMRVAGAGHYRLVAPAQVTDGRLVMTQISTVTRTNSAGTLVARVPDGSDVLDFIVTVTSAFASGAAGVVDVRIGTTANETRFGTIRASGAGAYRLVTTYASAGTGWNALTGGNTNIMARVTAVGSAMTIGQANVRTVYTMPINASAGTGWNNLTAGNTQIMALVTAVSSAMTVGQANVRTIYSQRA